LTLNYHPIIKEILQLLIMSMYFFKLLNNINVPHNDKKIFFHKIIKILKNYIKINKLFFKKKNKKQIIIKTKVFFFLKKKLYGYICL
jgi:hypothetical protein